MFRIKSDKEVISTEEHYDVQELLRRLCNGDVSVYEYLFNKYYPRLYHYSYKIVHDGIQADDIVQETFFRLYDHRTKLQHIGSIESYLYRIVYNASIDVLRHNKIKSDFIDKTTFEYYLGKVIQTPEAEQKLFEEDLNKVIKEAVARLPERCRLIFRMSKLEGYSNKEISQLLEISTKTIENQMTIALKKLRNELEWLLILIFYL